MWEKYQMFKRHDVTHGVTYHVNDKYGYYFVAKDKMHCK
jgi:hypothetical protein